MKLLVDTHVFLWYITGDTRIPAAWVTALRDPANDVYLSVISIWEACIKYHLGKLPLPGQPESYLVGQRQLHGITDLPFEESDLLPIGSLPSHHRDPFDRILICQALSRGLTLVTDDTTISLYSVPLLPK